MPLWQVQPAAATFDAGGVLLREHEWQMSIKCVSDHTVTFRFKNGEASAPPGISIEENWDQGGACLFRAATAH